MRRPQSLLVIQAIGEGRLSADFEILSVFFERLFLLYTQFYALGTYDDLAPDCFCFDIQRIFKWFG